MILTHFGPFWPKLGQKKDLQQVFKRSKVAVCRGHACAAPNACTVVKSNGQPSGQNKKKREPNMAIFAHFGSKMAKKKNLQQVSRNYRVAVCKGDVLIALAFCIPAAFN